jgi:hypothetical protein
MPDDPIGERQSRLCICSIHDPALAIAEDAPGCAIEHDLVNFVRLRRGDVKSILLIEAQMPQALRGYVVKSATAPCESIFSILLSL